jgi:hypothetical protein
MGNGKRLIIDGVIISMNYLLCERTMYRVYGDSFVSDI